jgi:hypothetical protein
MRQPGSPPLRVFAALAFVLYLFVLLGVPALLHPLACANHPLPHCVACGTANSALRVDELTPPTPSLGADAGMVAAAPVDAWSAPVAGASVERGPPAA